MLFVGWSNNNGVRNKRWRHCRDEDSWNLMKKKKRILWARQNNSVGSNSDTATETIATLLAENVNVRIKREGNRHKETC